MRGVAGASHADSQPIPQRDLTTALPTRSPRGVTRRRATCLSALLAAWLALPAAAKADDLTLLVHAPPDPAAHPPLIVLLHGSGADERDMIGLWHDLPAGLVVVSPRAPFHNAGGGYRWYRKASRETDIAVSRKIVDLVVDSVARRYDVDPHRIFIGGFSQGAVMTYAIALREPGRFRGAAVLSGTLFPSALAGALGGVGTAFFIGHGTADARIPFASATAARATLAARGVPVAFHAYAGMGHTTGAAEPRDLSTWLAAQLGDRPADAH